MNLKPDETDFFEWKTSVSIFKNRYILSQLAIGIGIPFGLLILLLIVMIDPKNISYTFYALGLLAGLFFFTFLLIILIYRGKYEVGFILDEKGIKCYDLSGKNNKKQATNGLTFVLGILSRKPAVLGTGMVAEVKQSIFIDWKDMRNVMFKPGQNTIYIKENTSKLIAVFCTKENFEKVKSIFEQHISGSITTKP